jgi:alkaline phosphatase
MKKFKQLETKIFVLIIVLAAVFIISSFSRVQLLQQSCSAESVKVRNVIMLIGDGMNNQQRRIAGIVEGNGDPNHRLTMESLPVAGIAFNHCLDHIVTDSAAAATALACGQKTLSGRLAMDEHGNKLKTILQACRDIGKSTGLITTVTISHATPAGFAAHVKTRNEYESIAHQYLVNRVDVLLGGGIEDFLPTPAAGKKTASQETGKRKDGIDLINEFRNDGYAFVKNRDELMKLNTAGTDKLLGLFSRGAMAYEIDRNPEKEPHIAEMTQAALDILSKNPNGFFLMVEGGKIDWANHGHDVAGSVYDTIAFDKAVKLAVDFATKNPDTLVIVVDDHETGGMAITARVNIKAIQNLKTSAERIARLIKKDGSNIDHVFRTYAGISNLSERDRKMVLDEVNGRLKLEDEWGYGSTIVARIISKHTGVHFSTGGHTGTPAVLAAYGAGSHRFGGYYDQTEIPLRIAELLGVKLK